MSRRGVTLIEMMIVVAIIGLMVGVTFPAVSSGVESLRLTSATDNVASFLNGALNRAERRQQVMEITISKEENKLTLRSTEPGYVRDLTMPSGVSITAFRPETPRIYLYPGGSVPRLTLELTNSRGAKKAVRVDPITGVPEIENLPGEKR